MGIVQSPTWLMSSGKELVITYTTSALPVTTRIRQAANGGSASITSPQSLV